MRLDFQLDGVKFDLDFGDPDCFQNDGIERVLIRTFNGSGWFAKSDMSAIRTIIDRKIVWDKWDEHYISKDAMDQCDRLVKLKVFA